MGKLHKLHYRPLGTSLRPFQPSVTAGVQDTTVDTHPGDEGNAPSSPLLPRRNQKAITGETSVGAVGPRA